MSRMVLSVVSVVFLSALFSCFAPRPEAEEFSGSGITITLTDEFWVEETVQAPFYLESQDHIFMGMRESKSDLTGYGIDSLAEYIEAVLDVSGHSSVTTSTYSEGSVTFMYAYYTATVSEVEYGYMLICKVGALHYYTMNFGCLNTNLEANKAQYLDWAATITVA